MKKCGKCKVLKEHSEFNKANTRKDGLAGSCRDCSRQALKVHYASNRAKHIADRIDYRKAKRQECKDYIASLNIKCSKCPENHIACIDFHHMNPKEKLYEISVLSSSGNISRLKTEMKKCIPLCSNCHRKLHFDERVPGTEIESVFLA